jgi:lycopene beta-cyclase
MDPVKYDFIIAGGGASGLSLAWHMLNAGLDERKILIVDRQNKNDNDRTWCFWEKEDGPFESIVYRKWSNITLHDEQNTLRYNIAPYSYKMIRSKDYYRYINDFLRGKSNVEFIIADILSMEDRKDHAHIQTTAGEFSGTYVFTSIYEAEPAIIKKQGYIYLIQHFLGWFIEAESDIFSDGEANLMDFRVSQDYGTCFCYVLPLNSRKALVEYTVFSADLLDRIVYENELKNYIKDRLEIISYQVTDSEFGIIPMTNYPFSFQRGNHIFKIGTAGGNTKPSTGYTFSRIQRSSESIVKSIIKNEFPSKFRVFKKLKFWIYDSTMLGVLQKNAYPGHRVFHELFRRNRVQTVLSFLDEETGFLQELKIMTSVRPFPFISAMLKSVFVMLSNRTFRKERIVS